MAALTQPRNTPTIGPKARKIVTQVAASAKLFAGGGVCLNATGFAVAAADTAGLTTWGRAEETVDNTGGADAALSMEVSRGVFGYKHTALVQADVGKTVYWSDDQTVTNAATATNDIPAGTLEQLDADGTAWVRILP